MSPSKNRRSRKIPGHGFSQRTIFDIGEYVQNPAMIKKLYEEREIAYAYIAELERILDEKLLLCTELELQINEIIVRHDIANATIKELEEKNKELNISLEEKNKQMDAMQKDLHRLQIKLTRAEGNLESASRNSFIQFLVSVIATVLLGFGINSVTATPSDWIGWVLVITGIILSVVAFTFVRKGK